MEVFLIHFHYFYQFANSSLTSCLNFAETYRFVIASQCAHWRGNLKMQGDVLCILKDLCQPKNIYYLRFPISFGNLNE